MASKNTAAYNLDLDNILSKNQSKLTKHFRGKAVSKVDVDEKDNWSKSVDRSIF